jgi:hypothetical protein
MTFAIHASKDGQSVVTIRIRPAVAVDKARVMERSGWQVHVTDSAGHQFDPSDFDRLSSPPGRPDEPGNESGVKGGISQDQSVPSDRATPGLDLLP